MTETPTNGLPIRHTNEDGSRFYVRVDPVTGEERRYWSVTTALSAKHKDGLKWWAAKLAAKRAMANIPMMLKAQRVDPCGRTWCRTEPLRCDRCPDCVQRWIELYHVGESERRKWEGSAIHDGVETWIKTGVWPNAATLAQPYVERHPTIAELLPPYLEQCERWVDDFGLRPDMFWASEMTIYNHTHRYAGTGDAGLYLEPSSAKAAKLVARVRGDLKDERASVLIDAKTREGEDKALYDDHPLQLVAYRRGETCRPSKVSEREFPMPVTLGALVFQPRPDGYSFEPVVTEEPEFRAFLAYLEAFRWQVERGPASIQVKSFPVPDGFEWPIPEPEPEPSAGAAPVAGASEEPSAAPAKKAARPRKAAAKKAAPRTVAEAAPRIAGATLGSLAQGGRRFGELRDEDIPF